MRRHPRVVEQPGYESFEAIGDSIFGFVGGMYDRASDALAGTSRMNAASAEANAATQRLVADYAAGRVSPAQYRAAGQSIVGVERDKIAGANVVSQINQARLSAADRISDVIVDAPAQQQIQRDLDVQAKVIAAQYAGSDRSPEAREQAKEQLKRATAIAQEKSRSLMLDKRVTGAVSGAGRALVDMTPLGQLQRWVQEHKTMIIAISVVAGVIVILYYTHPYAQAAVKLIRTRD